MDALYNNYRRLLSDTNTAFVRYLHDKIAWKSRFVAILGARGVGKTTMMLQHILLSHEEDNSLYISANDPYFASHTLFNTAEEFYKNGGKYLYIDEIHKYKDWSNDVKMMYDYLRSLQVVISGSSIISITSGIEADLSRRVVPFTLEGLSFREFLNFKLGLDIKPLSLEAILADKAVLPKSIEHPLPLYKEYLATGYFPFFREPMYGTRLVGTIEAAMEQDIASYADLSQSVVRKLKLLLGVIAHSVPFKPNYSDLGRTIGADRKIIPSYLVLMHKAALIRLLASGGDGMPVIEKAEKIYLGNTNYIHSISTENQNVGNERETAFYTSLLVNNDVRCSDVSDFKVGKYTFEVGGHKKGGKQIAGLSDAFVVRDDIEYGYKNTIPLWAFGLNY